jgi:hypothetical protein
MDELLDATADPGFEEEVLLLPHAAKTIQHAAARKIPNCLRQRAIAAMVPDFNRETSVAVKICG